MFRRAVSSFVLVAFVSMLFYSCSGEGSMNTGHSPGGTEAPDLEETLNADSDVAELLGIELQMIERALFGGVDSSQLRRALETEDPEYTAALFGYSATELETIEARVLQLCEGISERFPEIRERADELRAESCRACDVEAFLDRWDDVVVAYSSDIERSVCAAPARCEVVPLVVGLIMCAYTLGWTVVGYLACAYVVTCSFCEGGWADDIC